MNDLKKKMITKARRQYKQIYPCAAECTMGECFTVEEDRLFFWFNTEDESTHLITREIV